MKAITPVVGVILLVMITIAIIGFTFVFFGGAIEEISGETEERLTEQQRIIGTDAKFVSADAEGGDVSVIVKNTGNYPIRENTLLIIAENPDGEIIGTYTTHDEIEKGNTFKIETEIECLSGEEIKITVDVCGKKYWKYLTCPVSGTTTTTTSTTTTTTIPPVTETFYATASDGHVFGYGSNYFTIHDLPSVDWLLDTATVLVVGELFWNSYHYIFRSGLYFDTSSLPDDAVITDATLSLYGAFNPSNTDFDIVVVRGAELNDPLSLNDYGDLLDETESRGSINAIGFSIDGYNDITLNQLGLNEIDKAGTTKFGLRSSMDIDIIPPAGAEYVQIYSNEKGSGYQPKLTVTYS